MARRFRVIGLTFLVLVGTSLSARSDEENGEGSIAKMFHQPQGSDGGSSFNSTVADQQAEIAKVTHGKGKRNETQENKYVSSGMGPFQLQHVFSLEYEDSDDMTLIDKKSKYPILQVDLRLISDLVVIIVFAAAIGGIVFSCLGKPCSDKLGLSLELGSFVAAVMLSTTKFAQHTLDKVQPTRNLFAMRFPLLTRSVLLILLLPLVQSHSYTSSQKIQLPGDSLSLSVTDFGATGDGIHYDTSAIQSTINACNRHYTSSSLICHVKFPAGTYLTAKLHLRSGVLLDVTENAVLLGGPRIQDYPAKTSSGWYVVVANNATDVGITGGGAIDGQGSKFVVRFDEKKNVMVSWNHTGACLGDECRPRLVGFLDSTNVRIWNITLRQPAYWCLHIVRCEKISVHDVSILGDFNTPNNDGIDIEDSNNTVITKCHIDTGDDAICPKTYAGPLHNLTVTDCWIRTKSSAIKLGSASWFDFKGLVFDNITIFESHRGLGMQIRDGGNVSGITFSNINISTRYYDPSWWGRAEPIYITSCPRNLASEEGSISNLLFVNITIDSENGVFLSGSPNGLLTDINFKNMNITLRRWSNYTAGLVDYRPGCQGLVNHSGTAGIIMEHVKGFSVENVELKWSDDGNLNAWNVPLEFRPSTVNNVSFVGFNSGLLHEIVSV